MKLGTIVNSIFLDLDGVFVDFDKGVKDILGKYPHEMSEDEFWDSIRPHIKKGFFQNLPKMSDADTLWRYIKKYSPVFLTASGGTDHFIIQRDKWKWVNRTFGFQKTIVVKYSKEKASYANPNAILIDDREKSIKPWVAAGGIGILHKDANSTIEKLKEIGL